MPGLLITPGTFFHDAQFHDVAGFVGWEFFFQDGETRTLTWGEIKDPLTVGDAARTLTKLVVSLSWAAKNHPSTGWKKLDPAQVEVELDGTHFGSSTELHGCYFEGGGLGPKKNFGIYPPGSMKQTDNASEWEKSMAIAKADGPNRVILAS